MSILDLSWLIVPFCPSLASSPLMYPVARLSLHTLVCDSSNSSTNLLQRSGSFQTYGPNSDVYVTTIKVIGVLRHSYQVPLDPGHPTHWLSWYFWLPHFSSAGNQLFFFLQRKRTDFVNTFPIASVSQHWNKNNEFYANCEPTHFQ